MFDTAYCYPNHFELINQALCQTGIPRKDVQLISKIMIVSDQEEFLDTYIEQVDKNLSGYVDILLIHWPSTKGN